MPKSGTKLRVNNFAITNLLSYPLSCIAAIDKILAIKVFPKTKALRYAENGYHTYDYY